MRSIFSYIAMLNSIFFLGNTGMPVCSQISSPSADYVDTLGYPVHPEKDLYFVFHAGEQGNPVTGSLTAVAPGGTPGFDFSWSMYDPSSNTFDSPFHTESGVTTSMVDNLVPGYYQVQITSVDLDTLFRAWVFSNDSYVEVDKDENGKIKPYKYTCDYLLLNAVAEADTLTYYDLANGNTVNLPNGMTFEWTSDNADYEIPGATRFLDLVIYNNPPYSRAPTKDTWFTLTAVDSFGFSKTDDVLYESVHVKAEFTTYIEDKENPGDWIEEENPSGEAPLEVRFINLSENGVEFHWKLVDSNKTLEEDSEVITEDLKDSVVYTYYIPDWYFPTMTAYSEAGCVDSFPLVNRIEIQVKSPELDVADVSTLEQYYPNPVNDLLTIEAENPGQHSIEIISLSGQLIYNKKMEGPTHQIDLSSFEKGLYIITIRSKDFVRTEKIIKR
jgi:hypothetical protein